MGVNEETQVETKKRSVWVLTYSRDVSGQRDDVIMKVFTEKPTAIDLAHNFVGHSDKIGHGCFMAALAFLDLLVKGHERADDVGGSFALKEVTES